MSGYIRASRLMAMLLLAFLLWNEFASASLDGAYFAEAAGDPSSRAANVSSRGGPRNLPPPPGRETLLVVPCISPSPTPLPTPSPVPSPTPKPGPKLKPIGEFKVTAYSDSPRNGTDGRGITRSGTKTHWGVVAVDPGVIPLRTRLVIECMGDTVFTALDTGGGIIGNWVDVWYHSDDEALRHGLQFSEVFAVVE